MWCSGKTLRFETYLGQYFTNKRDLSKKDSHTARSTNVSQLTSPSSSAAPSVGFTRIEDEKDLHVFNETIKAEEHSQLASENVEYYVYTALIKTNRGAGILTPYSIAE